MASPQTVRFVWVGDHLSLQWHSSPCLEMLTSQPHLEPLRGLKKDAWMSLSAFLFYSCDKLTCCHTFEYARFDCGLAFPSVEYIIFILDYYILPALVWYTKLVYSFSRWIYEFTIFFCWSSLAVIRVSFTWTWPVLRQPDKEECTELYLLLVDGIVSFHEVYPWNFHPFWFYCDTVLRLRSPLG